jgi:DNA-binding GntR family transcriptional regulator
LYQVNPSVGYVLDHDSPVDLHEQLSNLLRSQIESGRLAGRIPSIKSLSQEYEVSTRTVERSLETLKEEGLIVARVGRGFFVKP